MSDKPRLQLEASRELEALLDDIHGKDRPTVGNGTYVDPWTYNEDGADARLCPAPIEGPSLHVTTDAQVWLNPDRTHYTGLCIGTEDAMIEDAVVLLEKALQALYAYQKRGV